MLGLVGLLYWNNLLLVLVAMFVYFAAAGESRMVAVRSMLRGIPVRAAMRTRFSMLSPRESLWGPQQDFPVVAHGRLVGLLDRTNMGDGWRGFADERRVADAMSRDFPVAAEDEPLEEAMMRMEGSTSALPVLRGDQLVGTVDAENVGRLMMIRSALRSRTAASIGGRTAA